MKLKIEITTASLEGLEKIVFRNREIINSLTINKGDINTFPHATFIFNGNFLDLESVRIRNIRISILDNSGRAIA